MPSLRTCYSDSKMLQPVQNFYNQTSCSIRVTWNFYSYTAKQLRKNTTHFFLVLFEILGLKKVTPERSYTLHEKDLPQHETMKGNGFPVWAECEERCCLRHIYWNNKNKYEFWRDCWTAVIKGQLFDFDYHNVRRLQVIYSSYMGKLKSEEYLLDPFSLWHPQKVNK